MRKKKVRINRKYKDRSYIFYPDLQLFEHQSTFSENMPLRGLLYLTDVLQGYVAKNNWNVFSSKRIILPKPKYVVFYNGTKLEPERQELRLSDSFAGERDEAACLEFKAIVLNINFGYNKELMEKSRKLYEYSKFIYHIRDYQNMGFQLEASVERAIARCLEEHILEDFLKKHRGEVYHLLLTEYDEEKFLEQEREVWKEEGVKEGLESGERRVNQLIRTLIQLSRSDEILRAVSDQEFQKQLFLEFNIT